mmetsp:Transcript_9101/g.13420  ORF Transcript_9101/g.13420 Transcript_9101/m.13420 type:complete len:86 (-) Transcript_9101:181-438(-)
MSSQRLFKSISATVASSRALQKHTNNYAVYIPRMIRETPKGFRMLGYIPSAVGGAVWLTWPAWQEHTKYKWFGFLGFGEPLPEEA